MNTTVQENRTWSTTHRIGEEDKAAMTAMRAIVEPNKGLLQGTAARGPFDSIMSRVVAPVGVTFAPDTVGGVSGWWCRSEGARTGQAILHLHGGWFNWGSAQAFRNLVGQSPFPRASMRLCPIIGSHRNIFFLLRLRMCVPVIWGSSSEDSQKWQLQETRPEAI
jgi:hypothetical protein